jgi:hypothetical protein
MTERLTLKRVEAELPPMTSPENVKLRLEMIQNWSLAGMVPGAVAGPEPRRTSCGSRCCTPCWIRRR